MPDYLRTIEKGTSVKRIGILDEPSRTSYGVADMTYRPVFSVFDWGTITPPIKLDNSTVCLMAGFNFELLHKQGIASHYLGLVTDQGEQITAKEAVKRGIAPTTMRVKFVNRVLPEHQEGVGWDYSMFGDPRKAANPDSLTQAYVQPVEFISRNRLGKASSVWKRIAAGEITMEDLGLPANFKPGDDIPPDLIPILDYSTKFEPDDRYPARAEIQDMMGITDERFARINASTRNASKIMTDYAASRGFTREDGKVEYITYMDNGRPMDELADAVCTWHEDRLLAFGLGVSKQRIRDKVVELNPGWYGEIQRAKKQAKAENVADFRTLMDPSIRYNSPSAEFFEAVNLLFQAATNMWVGRNVYPFYQRSKDSMANNLEKAIEDFGKVA
ncbi:MAG: phosphoribosylaminoimidazolesuccinocarboxamide synthase [Candidatus Woesearchaeota archaeon]